MLSFLVNISDEKKGVVIMYGTMVLSPQDDLQGTLLTREQVEEISDRISRSVYEDVSKQLKEAMASMP